MKNENVTIQAPVEMLSDFKILEEQVEDFFINFLVEEKLFCYINGKRKLRTEHITYGGFYFDGTTKNRVELRNDLIKDLETRLMQGIYEEQEILERQCETIEDLRNIGVL